MKPVNAAQPTVRECAPTDQPCCEHHHDTGSAEVSVEQVMQPPMGQAWTHPTRRWFLRCLMLALPGTMLPQWVKAAADAGPCGPPPPPKPAQAASAEGMPPLPLPVVPQRRTEKKNPPRPPVIAVKIQTGTPEDWATDINDLNNLLIWMKSQLGVNFTYDAKPLSEVDLEAGNVPVLYRTGHHAFTFSASERSRLREYILRGGMIIFDACCGRPEFAQSARAEIAAILPDHKLRPIPIDHPVYNSYHQNAGTVRFTPSSGLSSPAPAGLEGVEIACRMAIVFSPHDMSCGWDMHTHTTPGNTYIESEDALKIGANLIAYATATRDLSVSAAAAKAYVDAEKTVTDKFRIGQLMHEGDWNPDPVGLQNLLDTVGQTTSLKISFATDAIEISDESLSQHPFVYITGHDDFSLSEPQMQALRKYLANGGFIMADACCGRQKFDLAFRREFGRVLLSLGNQGSRLQSLPLDHPIFRIHADARQVAYTDAANAREAGKIGNAPRLEGATVNGRLAVVYSSLGLNTGWRLRPVAYAAGYQPKSAIDLGVDIVMYALAQ